MLKNAGGVGFWVMLIGAKAQNEVLSILSIFGP